MADGTWQPMQVGEVNDDAPADAPADDTLAVGTPADDTTADDTPAAGTPPDDTLADGTPAVGTPADDTPAGEDDSAPDENKQLGGIVEEDEKVAEEDKKEEVGNIEEEALEEEVKKAEEGKKEEKTFIEEAMKEDTVKDKVMKSQPLFDSRGSLLETRSFVQERLREFKQKRATVGVLISDLQAKVKEYKEKENLTDEDTANLKKYHMAFIEKLSEYEDMTRSLERLMGMEDVPTSQLDMTMSGPPISKPARPTTPAAEKPMESSVLDIDLEAKLPKLIVCGTEMGDSVPRIIVCEPLKKADLEPFHKTSGGVEGRGVDIMEKLNESFQTQQKLAAEKTEMANMRLQLQRELMEKQDMLDCMKQKMIAMECEKYKIQSENAELQKRLIMSQKPGGPPMCKRDLYMKLRGTSPDGGTTTAEECNKNLEQELVNMYGEVKNIYSDLECMQREKAALGYSTYSPKGEFYLEGDNARTAGWESFPEGVCMETLNVGCPSSSRKAPVCKRMLPQKWTQTDADKEKNVVFATDQDPKINELKEQYQRMHSDFKNKVTEVASLRVELEKTKRELDAIMILHHELEAIYQKQLDENTILTAEKNQIQDLKDKIIDFEQQANMAKYMYKTNQEEMEDMRLLIEDQANQLDEYRNKYLKTMQIAEELKKENEFKERECADEIAVEIQKVKLEMQEQLEELNPIKDLLKITQQKLKETEQMHMIALETIADVTKQLENANIEVDELKKKVDSTKTDEDFHADLINSLENADKRLTAMESENTRLKGVVSQLEGLQASQAQKLEERSHELLQMTQQLETLREESARQVARGKERSEMTRKCLHTQIAEMEREVAVCRAATSFAKHERDEIRSKLQKEVCLLFENFKESQNRILQLQQHVNYLRASHPTALIDLVG